MDENIIIHHKGKKKTISVRKLSFLGMFTGLMFKHSSTKILLFDFKKKGKHAIHSYFVFFRFLAVWLDKHNKVVSIDEVSPFKPLIVPKKSCHKLIEIPINRRYSEELAFFVGKKRKV